MNNRSWLVIGLALQLALTSACISVEVNRSDSGKRIPTVDRESILDLISQYSHTWDNRDANGWVDLFTPNAHWSLYANGELKNSIQTQTERLRFASETLETFTKQGIRTRHQQTNTLLTKNADGTIRGETIFTVVWQTTGEPSPKLVHSGVYRDVFFRSSAGWKFKRREIYIDHE